jgi:hypothetical protein
MRERANNKALFLFAIRHQSVKFSLLVECDHRRVGHNEIALHAHIYLIWAFCFVEYKHKGSCRKSRHQPILKVFFYYNIQANAAISPEINNRS